MSTSIVENIRSATEALVKQWHELPDDKIKLSVPESRDLTLKQQRLLRALGSLLDNWPDKETAKSVEISLGFHEKLRDLKPGKPIILTIGCPPEFQVEMIRLSEPVETVKGVKAFTCLKWCCCKYGQLYCCSNVGTLQASKGLPPCRGRRRTGNR